MEKDIYFIDTAGNVVLHNDYVIIIMDPHTISLKQLAGRESKEDFIFKYITFKTNTLLNITQIPAIIKINEFLVKAKILNDKDPLVLLLHQFSILVRGRMD